MTLTADKRADLWVQHNLLMWRAVYATPIIGVAVFAGWYSLLGSSQPILSKAVLALGIVAMLIQSLIIRRMAQYTIALLEQVGCKVADVPPPLFNRLNGVTMAMAVPIVIGLLFCLMLFFGESVVQISTAVGDPLGVPPKGEQALQPNG